MKSRMNTAVVLVTGAVLISSCSSGHVDSTMGPSRPEPDFPPAGPVVASLDIDETTFVMHDEGDGRVALEILHPGLQTTVDHAWADGWNTLSESSTCGWLAEAGNEDPMGCDVELPRVLFGRITDPDVGYVCVGSLEHFEEDPGFAVTGVRFLERDADGYILQEAQPGEVAAPHLLTAGGTPLGYPPMDAPSDPIYRACEEATGIEAAERVVQVLLLVEADEALTGRGELSIMVTAGVERGGISMGAFENGEPVPLLVGVTPTAYRFEVSLVGENYSKPLMRAELEWPGEIDDLLAADEPCIGLTTVEVSLGPGVLDGDGGDIIVRFAGSECGSVGS